MIKLYYIFLINLWINLVKKFSFFLAILCLLSFTFASKNYAKPNIVLFPDFSRNKKIHLQEIKILGNYRISKKKILEILDLKEDSNFFLYEIDKAKVNLIESGFFSYDHYKIERIKYNSYKMTIQLKENPPLASVKILDEKMLNLEVLKEKFSDEHFKKGKPFSSKALERAIRAFNIYNQNYGIFLYRIQKRILTSDEIEKVKGQFLFQAEDLKQPGLHVVIYIKSVPSLYIREIKMVGLNQEYPKVNYDEILDFAQFRENIWIQNDDELFFRYKRMRRLGFYSTIYFKLEPIEDDFESPSRIYRLVISVKELEVSEFATVLTSPANIGVITSIEYYDIAFLNSLQRLRLGAGWEIRLGRPIFIAEYTHPYFWKKLFFDATFEKSDSVDVIKDSDNQKLINTYELKLTVGANLYGNFSGYFFQKESYLISSTVDSDYERVEGTDKQTQILHSSGLIFLFDNLDDNFFIRQGYKLSLEYEIYWQKLLAHKLGMAGELYVPLPNFGIIAAIAHRSYGLFTSNEDKETTLSLDERMRTNVQEIETSDNLQIKVTTYTSLEIRIPIPPFKKIVRDLSFVIFAEMGGAWADFDLVSLAETRYGFGIGLRLSPKKHYSSFLFSFPAAIYLGYRTGDKKPDFAGPISHRDDLYYINLTASF